MFEIKRLKKALCRTKTMLKGTLYSIYNLTFEERSFVKDAFAASCLFFITRKVGVSGMKNDRMVSRAAGAIAAKAKSLHDKTEPEVIIEVCFDK